MQSFSSRTKIINDSSFTHGMSKCAYNINKRLLTQLPVSRKNMKISTHTHKKKTWVTLYFNYRFRCPNSIAILDIFSIQ